MNPKYLFLVIFFLGGTNILLPDFQSEKISTKEGYKYAEATLQATVKIECFDTGKTFSEKGAGVLLRSDGLIITNYHNIDLVDNPIIEVTLYDGRVLQAAVLHSDPQRDLTLLTISLEQLPFFTIGKTKKLQIGEPVFAVGHPHQLDFTLTSGIISALNRELNVLPFVGPVFIQNDVPINPGCSGGPLLNHRGDLIGINTAIVSQLGRFEGYAFAIPIEVIIGFMQEADLKEQTNIAYRPRNGSQPTWRTSD